MCAELRLLPDPDGGPPGSGDRDGGPPDGGPPDGDGGPRGPIRVLLADDHAGVRRSLRQVLDGEQNIAVIAEAHDLPSLLHELDRQPAVLALDPSLEGSSGSETLLHLREQAPAAQIVVLSMHDDPGLARQALRAGAIGFVLKEMAASDLPSAIRDAAAGRRYVSPRIATRMSRRDEL